MRRNTSIWLLLAMMLSIRLGYGAVLDTRSGPCSGPKPTCENCCGIRCCHPEDDCDGSRCVPPPPPPLVPPNDIGLQMQWQQSYQWCWIAVATSINHFYNSGSTWTQCEVMTDVGHRLNNFDLDTDACPHPGRFTPWALLYAELADPYNGDDLYILDDPRWGVNSSYLKSGNVKDPLDTTGNWASDQAASLSLDQISAEINAARPVVANIAWNTGGQHSVAIGGVSSNEVLILDPVSGRSVMPWSKFPFEYGGGATLVSYDFTKA